LKLASGRGVKLEERQPLPQQPRAAPVLATPFIRANLRRALAMIHSTSTTKSTTLRSVNGHVEPTHAIRQEPVGASFLGRQPALSPHNGAGPAGKPSN